MQTKTYHLICYFLFALALVLIGTIGSAGIRWAPRSIGCVSCI